MYQVLYTSSFACLIKINGCVALSTLERREFSSLSGVNYWVGHGTCIQLPMYFIVYWSSTYNSCIVNKWGASVTPQRRVMCIAAHMCHYENGIHWDVNHYMVVLWI